MLDFQRWSRCATQLYLTFIPPHFVLLQSGQKDDRTAEEIHGELVTLRHQLDMNSQTNAGVVEQFRNRQAEIAKLKQTIEEREEKLVKVEQRITRTRVSAIPDSWRRVAKFNFQALWEPALKNLVDSIGEKFSAAFDRIGCAGEVKVAEHDDYDKWTIDILVKFRDNEKLQLLTAETQSGGVSFVTKICNLDLTFCTGTIVDHYSVPYEFDGTCPGTVLSRRRDQPRDGRTGRACCPQLSCRRHLQTRQWPILPDYTQATSRPDVPRAHEGSLRQ